MELKKTVEIVTIFSGLLNELLAVLERETVEMGALNVTAMGASNQEKEALIKKISDHELILKRAVSALALREGLAPAASLGSVAEFMAKRGRKELLEKRLQVKSAADKIQHVAALNREIAEKFSTTVATTLTLITRLTNQSNVYGSSGGYQQPRKGAVMINMEA